MSKMDLIIELKETIEKLQKNGETQIELSKLITYLQLASENPPQDLPPDHLEKLKAQLQILVEAHKSNHASDLEMFRSVMQSGQNAIKTSFLMNGGASVAILAFIGKLTESNKPNIPIFAETLTLFVIGVFLISVTAGLTYLSQWFYAEDSSRKQLAGSMFNFSAVVVGLGSYGMFIWGMKAAYDAFLSLT
ncbi:MULTISPECIES: hypothetical protein [Pseudomonas]|uniref:Transmembrane protein n=1 Tax=Pseudomonas fluorescens TaxID=294 RepID=A0A0N9WS76_PSEFL|nr:MULTISPECIES: hypothetical protein [Pseudomonas]ALI05591.1 hypothetical protein AO356_01955 [Pseudomonas fluorescens]